MSLSARPGAPLRGTAAIPGDKSGSHRALIIGAMAEGETRIHNLAEGDDVLATARALTALGVTVERLGPGEWRVAGGTWTTPADPIDCGNSGTTARLLMGAVAGMPGVAATFTGDASLSRRPMKRVTDLLRRMGATIDGGDTLPITIAGARLGGIDHRNVPASAQVKTALLFAGLGTSALVRILEPVPSRDHAEIMLGRFGVVVGCDDSPDGWVISLGEKRALEGTEVTLGADPSSAAFPLVAGLLVSGSEVRVEGMLVNPLRTGLYDTLEAMGATIDLSNERLLSGEIVADVVLRHAALRPCHVLPEQIPAMVDEIPILAVACALADGESVIEGLGELQVKESDRLSALVAGLTACGVSAVADGETLRITGRGAVRGGSVQAHGDHRVAMAFLTLGLASEQGVTIESGEMIATSFPGYVETMQSLGADIG